jgi:hypothetical protein
VYQYTARTTADLAVKVDKFNHPPNPTTISGSTSTISSGSKTTGLIPQPKNLHCHSKRGVGVSDHSYTCLLPGKRAQNI